MNDRSAAYHFSHKLLFIWNVHVWMDEIFVFNYHPSYHNFFYSAFLALVFRAYEKNTHNRQNQLHHSVPCYIMLNNYMRKTDEKVNELTTRFSKAPFILWDKPDQQQIHALVYFSLSDHLYRLLIQTSYALHAKSS